MLSESSRSKIDFFLVLACVQKVLCSWLSSSQMHSVASSSSVPFPDYDNVVASTWSLLEQVRLLTFLYPHLSSLSRPLPLLCAKSLAHITPGVMATVICFSQCSTPRALKIKSVSHLYILPPYKSHPFQRVASVAALQRAMLQVYQGSPPPSPHPALLSSENPNYSPFTRSISLRDHTSSTSTHHSSRRPTLPSIRSQHSLSASLPPRKRHRTVSRSPPSRQHTHDRDHNTHSHSALSPHELPPSPHSWSSGNESAEYSPRTRQSMAIGSLLSSRPDRDDDGRNTNSSEPN